MTSDEFLDKLSRLRYKKSGKPLRWAFTYGGSLRVSANSHCYCPITAVVKPEGYAGPTNPAAYFGGPAVGLSEPDSYKILWAADSRDAAVAPLRARLLKACNLTEAS